MKNHINYLYSADGDQEIIEQEEDKEKYITSFNQIFRKLVKENVHFCVFPSTTGS